MGRVATSLILFRNEFPAIFLCPWTPQNQNRSLLSMIVLHGRLLKTATSLSCLSSAVDYPQIVNDLPSRPWVSLCPASSVEVCNHVAVRAQSEHSRSTFGATIGSHSEHAKNGTLLFHALEEGLGT